MLLVNLLDFVCLFVVFVLNPLRDCFILFLFIY